MADRPCYPAAGWTVAGGITPERQRRMRDEIGDGIGYVE
jgi:hypothetical protein